MLPSQATMLHALLSLRQLNTSDGLAVCNTMFNSEGMLTLEQSMIACNMCQGCAWACWHTSLTVTTLSEVSSAPFRMLTAGPLMDAQLGYSQDSGSYLQTHASSIANTSMDKECRGPGPCRLGPVHHGVLSSSMCIPSMVTDG